MISCRCPAVFRNIAANGNRCFGRNVWSRCSGSVAHIIGCYKTDSEGFNLTPCGNALNAETNDALCRLLKISQFKGQVGKTKTFYGLSETLPCVTVAGLGEMDASDDSEDLDLVKENTRIGMAAAAVTMQSSGFDTVHVDPCSSVSAVAEGLFLSTHQFQEFKTDKEKKSSTRFMLNNSFVGDAEVESKWKEGQIYSEGQNFARRLMEMPSNYKYPRKFVDLVHERFSELKNLSTVVRDKSWLQEKKMGCFLSVAQGSVHEPILLEVHYNPTGVESTPVVLVGKGITFDAIIYAQRMGYSKEPESSLTMLRDMRYNGYLIGGISLKPSQGMALMRGDMGGAACVLGAIEAASRLALPLRVVALVALSENTISGAATKPGDVFMAMNGKTVEVDNTDAEGRLVLADTLCYAHSFKPSTIIDVATLTGAMDVALGAGATGVFCNNKDLWSTLHEAGKVTGDRLWRMPVYKYYSSQMDCSLTADLRNTQKKARSAGSCTAAAFLKEFVDMDSWAHFDIAGVMSNEGDVPYLGKGMSGRPTRTLIEALRMLSVKKPTS